MAAKGLTAQRDELVEEQLRGIRETLSELKTSLATVVSNLDSVRIAELSAIRTSLSDVAVRLTAQLATELSAIRINFSNNADRLAAQDSEIKLLRYQMGRTTAVWSLVSSGVMSTIVAAVMAVVMHR